MILSVTIGTGILAVCATALAIPATAANAPMPSAQQNQLIQKYCAICHTDASMNGGLSLEHFDAARPDPGVAAMIVSKLKAKALGAAGLKLPDQATQDALQSALTEASKGSGNWNVTRAPDPKTHAPVFTAGIVRGVPNAKAGGDPDLYRLTLTCGAETRQSGIQLAWSPGVPKNGTTFTAEVDGAAPVQFKVEGEEKMGNGQDGTSGPGAIVLTGLPLPSQTLTVRGLFGPEPVVFPFDRLPAADRRQIAACLGPASH